MYPFLSLSREGPKRDNETCKLINFSNYQYFITVSIFQDLFFISMRGPPKEAFIKNKKGVIINKPHVYYTVCDIFNSC